MWALAGIVVTGVIVNEIIEIVRGYRLKKDLGQSRDLTHQAEELSDKVHGNFEGCLGKLNRAITAYNQL